MSTDGPDRPRTRAELRAQRGAEPRPEPVAASEPRPAPETPWRRRENSEDAARRRPRRFLLTLIAVTGALALLGAGLAYIGINQGPRLSSVQVDPAEAIALSGSRVILHANQPLEAVAAEQVVVAPEVPFTVDATGRSVGVRFTVPLDDATEYTVTVSGVVGIGGGPASDLTTTFTTPPSEVYLLQRSAGEDTIFRTDLAGEARPVFTHERINDFRRVEDRLVVVVEEGESSRVLVVDGDDAEPRELSLPGDGYVNSVQVSDRGSLVGFLYSDRDLTEASGRASVLVTQPLSGAGEPSVVEIAGDEPNIAEWRFVPDTASVLFIDFSGSLWVADRATQDEPSPMGIALSIQGIERGTYAAIIQRADGTLFRLDLADGSESELAASDPDYGVPVAIAPYPGGTTQHIIARDDVGIPIGQAIVRVDDDGTATPVIEVGDGDAILQACPSPSGQYLAVSIAPDLPNNHYDDMLLSLPERMETHLLDLRTGEQIVALAGFDISWCAFGPEL